MKKIKILGALLELYQLISTANLANLANFEVNWLDWQCCLAGSSKRAPRILIFSITMGADYSFYVKFIATRAPTFFGYIISVLASVSDVRDNKSYFRKCGKNRWKVYVQI